jgi:hypothetical protein
MPYNNVELKLEIPAEYSGWLEGYAILNDIPFEKLMPLIFCVGVNTMIERSVQRIHEESERLKMEFDTETREFTWKS